MIEVSKFSGNKFSAEFMARSALIAQHWTDLSRIDVDLDAGEIVIGVRGQNVEINSEQIRKRLSERGFQVNSVTYCAEGRPQSE